VQPSRRKAKGGTFERRTVGKLASSSCHFLGPVPKTGLGVSPFPGQVTSSKTAKPRKEHSPHGHAHHRQVSAYD